MQHRVHGMSSTRNWEGHQMILEEERLLCGRPSFATRMAPWAPAAAGREILYTTTSWK